MFEITWEAALSICYYLGAIASLLAVIQSIADYKREGQWFRLLGIPAHLGLALALCFIIIGTGADPVRSKYFIQVGVRISFMVWAIFKLLFEIFYCKTFFSIKKPSTTSEGLLVKITLILFMAILVGLIMARGGGEVIAKALGI